MAQCRNNYIAVVYIFDRDAPRGVKFHGQVARALRIGAPHWRRMCRRGGGARQSIVAGLAERVTDCFDFDRIADVHSSRPIMSCRYSSNLFPVPCFIPARLIASPVPSSDSKIASVASRFNSIRRPLGALTKT